jgi:NADH-quinone oxidoreductase subunit E
MKFGFQTASDGETDQLSITTPDGSTTLRTVACFGQCALAPVIEINHAIFGHMNEMTLQRELEALDQREPST